MIATFLFNRIPHRGRIILPRPGKMMAPSKDVLIIGVENISSLVKVQEVKINSVKYHTQLYQKPLNFQMKICSAIEKNVFT